MNSSMRKDDPNTVHDIGQIYELQMLIIILALFKDGFLPKTKTNAYSPVLHSHTALMKVCPCGRYRQLNSVLHPNNHIPESSKIRFNGLFLI